MSEPVRYQIICSTESITEPLRRIYPDRRAAEVALKTLAKSIPAASFRVEAKP